MEPAVERREVVRRAICKRCNQSDSGCMRPHARSARSLPLGTVVTVDGSVIVPSGAFSSSTFDQGFAIQDRTGGIYVSVGDDLGFAPRQQVRVSGTLADSVLPGPLVLIDVTEIKAHGSGPKV